MPRNANMKTSMNAEQMEKEFQTGLQLIQNGQAAKAGKKLGKLLKHLPDNPTLLERIGYCYALQQNWKLAEEYYEKASSLSPLNSEILNNYGCVLQNQDRWADALPYFSRAYDASPGNFSALSNLAQTLNHCGLYEMAEKHYLEALHVRPQNLPMRFQLAEIYYKQQQHDQELELYQQIIDISPNNPKATLKRAIALFALGREEEALTDISKDQQKTSSAISLLDWARAAHESENFKDATYGFGLLTLIMPDNADFWRGYVINHYFAFGLQKSVEVLEKAIRLFPNELAFQRTLTIAYGQEGESEKAVATAKKIIEQDPLNAKAQQNYAVVLRQHQKSQMLPIPPDEACEHFNKAICLAVNDQELLQAIAQSIIETKEPDLMRRCLSDLPKEMESSYLFNMLTTFVLTQEGNLELAITHAQKCTELEPENSFAMSELSETWYRMENYDEALKAGREAVRLNPKDSQALMRLGYLSVDCGLVDEGIELNKQALAHNPHDPSVQLSLGLMTLLKGDWENGWKYYDARFRMQYNNKINIPPIPRWDGSQIEGLRLVIICEQGFGDVIQFARFIPEAAQKAKQTLFVSKGPLMHMFKDLSEQVEIVSASEKASIEASNAHWVSLLDLPRVLNIPEDQWGANTPYLRADPDKIENWSNQLDLQNEKLNIGIAWQGSPGARIDVGRSIALKYFEPISQIENIQLFSLQKFYGEEQIEQVTFNSKIKTLGDSFDTGAEAFSDTMAVMTNMDLIITSDTSIAHLAGALGRPTWLALKHVPDWRWGLTGKSSIWYPSMRLFRQPKPGDWKSVFRNISNELKNIPNTHKQAANQ